MRNIHEPPATLGVGKAAEVRETPRARLEPPQKRIRIQLCRVERT
jgi:hypothetical protein